MERMHYMVIDQKSFYASVECVARGLDPMTAKLVVADPDRSQNTICLAVSPSMKLQKQQQISFVNMVWSRERALLSQA